MSFVVTKRKRPSSMARTWYIASSSAIYLPALAHTALPSKKCTSPSSLPLFMVRTPLVFARPHICIMSTRLPSLGPKNPSKDIRHDPFNPVASLRRDPSPALHSSRHAYHRGLLIHCAVGFASPRLMPT